LTKSITETILSAANRSIPTTLINKSRPIKSKPYWNKKCAAATKKRNYQRNRLNKLNTKKEKDKYKELKGKAQKIIEESKTEFWQKYCNSINENEKLGSVWKTAKKIEGKSTSSKSIPVLDVNNTSYVTNLDKANILAKTFASANSDANYNPTFLEKKKRYEETRQKEFLDDSSKTEREEEINKSFEINELLRAIKEAKKKSSPGVDTIPYAMIKEVPHSTLMLILAHYNEIWKSGMIPQEWKHALINPILKPGKNPRSPESYRPISLTATLCKIMEKMVTKEINLVPRKQAHPL